MRMAQLHEHAEQLFEDLGFLADGGLSQAGKPIVNVYNELLKQTRERFPEDPLIDTLTPIGDAIHPRVLRTLVGQLRLVLGNA